MHIKSYVASFKSFLDSLNFKNLLFCCCLAINSIISYDFATHTTTNLYYHTSHIAIESKAVSIKSTVGVELLKEKNYPQIAAVGMAAGQGREPRIVDIRWDSPITTDAEPIEIVIIGKGITFDTGGLNIKGGGGMRNMKRDMAGSAQALALALWIVETKLAVSLRLLLPIAENSISGIALRPGMSSQHSTIQPHTKLHNSTLVLVYFIASYHEKACWIYVQTNRTTSFTCDQHPISLTCHVFKIS